MVLLFIVSLRNLITVLKVVVYNIDKKIERFMVGNISSKVIVNMGI